jgi:hypothetical protein
MSIQGSAQDALGHLHERTRADGSTFYSFDDSARDTYQDLAQAAHDGGDILPDDYRYLFMRDALEAIAEAGEGEDLDDAIRDAADRDTDIYTHDLTSWLDSRNDRTEYVDEAMGEDGATSVFQALQLGQYHEREEVYSAVLCYLRAHDDSDEEEE